MACNFPQAMTTTPSNSPKPQIPTLSIISTVISGTKKTQRGHGTFVARPLWVRKAHPEKRTPAFNLDMNRIHRRGRPNAIHVAGATNNTRKVKNSGRELVTFGEIKFVIGHCSCSSNTLRLERYRTPRTIWQAPIYPRGKGLRSTMRRKSAQIK